ncbi:MAG: HU family DNA-binding protein, partial [Butyricimonas virosa]
MNKRELTTLIAERTGLKKKDVHATLQATIDCISEAIQAGERVTFMGFGSFYTQERGPRMSYNVYTKERRHLDTRKV